MSLPLSETESETSVKRKKTMTPAALLANQTHGRLSRGPGAEAKNRTRHNACKHNLGAESELLPGEDGAELDRRLEVWPTLMSAQDELQVLVAQRVVHMGWRMERAERSEDADTQRRTLGTAQAAEDRRAEDCFNVDPVINDWAVAILGSVFGDFGERKVQSLSAVLIGLRPEWMDDLEFAQRMAHLARQLPDVATATNQIRTYVDGMLAELSPMAERMVEPVASNEPDLSGTADETVTVTRSDTLGAAAEGTVTITNDPIRDGFPATVTKADTFGVVDGDSVTITNDPICDPIPPIVTASPGRNHVSTVLPAPAPLEGARRLATPGDGVSIDWRTRAPGARSDQERSRRTPGSPPN